MVKTTTSFAARGSYQYTMHVWGYLKSQPGLIQKDVVVVISTTRGRPTPTVVAFRHGGIAAVPHTAAIRRRSPRSRTKVRRGSAFVSMSAKLSADTTCSGAYTLRATRSRR